MGGERETKGYKLLSGIYYNQGFGSNAGVNLQGCPENQAKLKEGFIKEVSSAVESGQITVGDLITFLARVKVSHEIDSDNANYGGTDWD